MTKYLSLKEILRLHFQVIEDFGGSHGIRDDGRLKSLELAPQQAVFGAEQYSDIFEKAAVYARNLIGDHPFVDGNKRTGVTAAGVFLIRNGYGLTALPTELEDFAVAIATEKLDVTDIAIWLKDHSQKL
jgi:death on curing protein